MALNLNRERVKAIVRGRRERGASREFVVR